MPTKPTGTVYESDGSWYASITIATKKRRSFRLVTCQGRPAAEARGALLAAFAVKLRAAHADVDLIADLLKRAGARDGKELAEVRAAIEAVCKGQTTANVDRAARKVTFEDVGKRWTSGDLAREYPDHVKGKKSAERDRQRLERYIYPLVRGLAVVDFTLDHAEAVMKALPKKRVKTAATRRHVAQIMHRVLGLAVFPMRLIKVSPIPRGFLPKLGPGKAKGWLYPSEDRKLLASPDAPLAWRVLYGFLHREGPRLSEAAALDLADVDLDLGAVKLDENKTDDPRAWALSPGVAPALAAWVAHRARAAGKRLARTAPLFVDEEGKRISGEGTDLAKKFRAHLAAAGVDRAELFERTASRVHIRLHDTRATFVTISLANGRSETWVADRTGHRSSQMINKYRRAARTAEELGLGELARLDVAIPELAPPPVDDGEGGLDGEPPPPGDDAAPVAADASGSDADASGSGADGREPSPDPQESAEISTDQADEQPDTATLNPLIMVRIHAPEPAFLSAAPVFPTHHPDTSRGTPRGRLLDVLFELAREAAADGDLEAARIAHRAAGELLGDRPGDVVDLERERRRRG